MTVCQLLAEKQIGKKTVSAWKNQDKFSNVWNYEICISEDGFCYETIKTAKTTWKRKFNSIVKET